MSSQAGAKSAGGAGRRSFLLLWVAPSMLLLGLAVLPLIAGGRTLHLRDVFNTHLEMKAFQAEAMREGRLPLVDPYRAGGQAHLGNPNTVPLYPDNLLYLVAPTFWAMNAHFWIHLLLAPWALFWLARAWGLRREAAWTAGVCYAGSGFFLSTLNLYNLVAGAALAPALAAAALDLVDRPRRPARPFVALALLWTLLLLAGDPMVAAAALLLAVSAVVARFGLRRTGWGATLGALGLGTLLATPQILEFLRILGASFRGHWGYSVKAATAASWNPVTAVEWLLPLVYGSPGVGFWGSAYHGGAQPLFYSLAPGALTLALVAASGWPRGRAALWAWGVAVLGLFLALGRSNPVVYGLVGLLDLDLLRFPVKLWLLVAVGGSILAGIGLQRVLERRHGLGLALASLAAFYAVAWALLGFRGAALDAWLRARVPAIYGDPFVAHEVTRWAGICLLSLLLLGLAALLVWLAGRRPGAAAWLPVAQLALQLLLLRPLLSSEPIGPYAEPPELLREIPADAILVHGDAGGLFGPDPIPVGNYPDLRMIWLQRQTHRELFPQSGMRWGRRYEFNLSPEGLDAFLTRATSQAIQLLPDRERLRILAVSGVDRLLLGRRLAPGAEASGAVRRLGARPTVGGELHLYAIEGRVERARFVGRVLRAPHLNAAVARITDPDFDPRLATVLPGEGPDAEGSGGEVTWLSEDPEAMELEVRAESAGALVVQRTLLPLYRAEVNGRAAPLVAADLHRIGLELPPGVHRVRIGTDRRPLRLSLALALAAALALSVVAGRLSRRGP